MTAGEVIRHRNDQGEPTATKAVAEKVRSVPKELARRGLESGVERLRGQLGTQPSMVSGMSLAATH